MVASTNRRAFIRTLAGAGVTLGAASGLTRVAAEASGTTVFAIDSDHSIIAVDGDTQESVWEFTEPESRLTAPTVADGVLYVGDWRGTQYAIEVSTGEVLWTVSKSWYNVNAASTIVDGTVFVGVAGEGGGHLYALEAESGDTRWVFEDGLAVEGAPRVDDGTIYVGTEGGESAVYAIDAETGEPDWTYAKTDETTIASVTIDSDSVYANVNGDIVAIDRDSGEEVWNDETLDGSASPPTFRDGLIYVTDPLEGLYAFDADSGDLEWEYERDAWPHFTTSTISADGIAYVGHSEQIRALDAATGSVEWVHSIDDLPYAAPTVYEDTVYCSDGTDLLVMDAESGEVQWKGSGLGSTRTAPTVVEEPESGNSVDSRVKLATYGHHEETVLDESSGVFGIPGFGPGAAVAGLAGASYLAYRKRTNESDG